jgi:hypothetical protein
MSVGTVLKGMGKTAAVGVGKGLVGAAKITGKTVVGTAKVTGKTAYHTAKLGGKAVNLVDKAGSATFGKLGEKTAESLIKNRKEIGKKIVDGAKKSVVELPEEERNSVFTKLVKHRLNNKVAAGAFLATGGFTLASMANEGNNVGNLGRIEATQMANTINFTRSPILEQTVDAMDANEQFAEQASKTMFGCNTHGAEGDLVFALHNLRNR